MTRSCNKNSLLGRIIPSYWLPFLPSTSLEYEKKKCAILQTELQKQKKRSTLLTGLGLLDLVQTIFLKKCRRGPGIAQFGPAHLNGCQLCVGSISFRPSRLATPFCTREKTKWVCLQII